MLRRSLTTRLFAASCSVTGAAPPEQIQARHKSIEYNEIESKPLFAQYYVDGKNVNSVKDLRSAGVENVILVAHGLLGSSRNWNGTIHRFGGHLKKQLEMNWVSNSPVGVAALDLRNHGNSPHAYRHTMDAMCIDIENFADELLDELETGDSDKSLKSLGIVAHSMGGATAINLMSWCRKDPSLFPVMAKYLKAALIVDICPSCRPITAFNNIEAIFEGMKELDFDKHPTIRDADKALRHHIENPALRAFALTNFVPEGKNEKVARWRCNFPVLYEETMSKRLFSEQSPIVHDVEKGDKITVPTMFIFGEDSGYNNPEGRKQIPVLFEDVDQIAIPGAGHYVHVEKPMEFSSACGDFFAEKLFGVQN